MYIPEPLGHTAWGSFVTSAISLKYSPIDKECWTVHSFVQPIFTEDLLSSFRCWGHSIKWGKVSGIIELIFWWGMEVNK